MSKTQAEKMLNCAKKFVLAERSREVENGQDEIAIEWRGENSWAIVLGYGDVLNKDDEVEYEPIPSNRDEDFLERTRFPLEEAWTRAENFIRKNGFKPAF